MRLAHFARVQAAHRAAGWRIGRAEFAIEGFELDGMPVTGRIDRLDVHDDGRVLVLDYKTSDRAETPEEAHLAACRDPGAVAESALADHDGKPARWINLQLPLYLLALREEFRTQNAERRTENAEYGSGGAPLLCGYFSLPKAVTETCVATWAPEPDLLASAERCAKGVIAAVRAGTFWPPARAAWNPDRDDLAAALIPEGFAPEDCFKEKNLSPE